MLDCEKPNKGEQLVKQYLEDNGYCVMDVSKDQHYWTQDIDFIAIKGKETVKIEVKYDSWINRTRNLFIELLSDIDANKAGWIDYCKADYLYYVDAVSLSCYIIPLENVRDYLRSHDYMVKECLDRDGFGNVYKRSQGALVNVDIMCILYGLNIIDLGVQVNQYGTNQTI